MRPGAGTPMLLAMSLSNVRASAHGAVSVAPKPVRNAMRSPQVSTASRLISSNTPCEMPAPANHSTLRRLKKLRRSPPSARRWGSSAS